MTIAATGSIEQIPTFSLPRESLTASATGRSEMEAPKDNTDGARATFAAADDIVAMLLAFYRDQRGVHAETVIAGHASVMASGRRR